VEKFISAQPQTADDLTASANGMSPGMSPGMMPNGFRDPRMMDPRMTDPRMRRPMLDPSAPNPAAAAPAPDASAGTPLSKNSTNEVSVVTVLFRGVNVANSTTPSANTDIAYAVESALKQSPAFDPAETQLSGTIDTDPNGTFTFGVNLKLKRPMKL
jgi:hypothetical protein